MFLIRFTSSTCLHAHYATTLVQCVFLDTISTKSYFELILMEQELHDFHATW